MENSKDTKIQYDVPRCYLEMARAVMTSLHHPFGKEKFIEAFGLEPIASAKLSLVSVSVVFSYLAIEAFVNAQLYYVWKRRHDGSPESKRFLKILDDIDDFEKLKLFDKVRELGPRIKTLCEIMAYRKPHEVDPKLWENFKKFVEVSRHFFVHPYPDPMFFHSNMSRIMEETRSGVYSEVAASIIGHLYDQAKAKRPDWLAGSSRFRIRGVEMVSNHGEAG